MLLVIPTAELTSFAFLLIVAYGMFFKNRAKNLKNLLFRFCVLNAMLSLLFDSLSYLLDGLNNLTWFLYILNTLSFVCGYGIIIPFVYYLVAVFREKEKTSFWFAHSVTILCIAFSIVTIIGSAIGKTFTLTNGYYAPGTWATPLMVSKLAFVAYLFVLIGVKSKYLKHEDTVALLSYVVLPIISVVIEVIIPLAAFSFVAVAVSLTIMYVVFQTRAKESAQLRERIAGELSTVDILTGMKNRLAYERTLAGFSAEENLGVLFCDLNGLKNMNDTYGHSAGDQLLVYFSEMIRDNFPDDAAFRISGDEFVIIIKNNTQSAFEERASTFAQDCYSNSNIASVGAAFGRNVVKLILDAEKQMYDEKDRYYLAAGKVRRVT